MTAAVARQWAADAGDVPHREEVLSRLTNPASVSQERLPMLDVVIDRLVRLLTTSVRQLTSRNARITVVEHTVQRFGHAVAAIRPESLIAVVNAREWDNKLLVTADTDMVYSCVDILLGGKARGMVRLEGQRSFSPIERRLSERLLRLLIQDLERAFGPISEVNFECERLETNPEFAAICRESNPTVVIVLNLDFGSVSGRLWILLPYATLEPIRKLLLQMFMGEKFGRDPVWERHLRSEIQRTELKLKGVLHERMIPLGEVTKWHVGMTIPLNVTAKAPAARLTCNDSCLFHGEMGQSNGNIAVRIDAPADLDQEALDALVSD